VAMCENWVAVKEMGGNVTKMVGLVRINVCC
jgi:hypothetical protein